MGGSLHNPKPGNRFASLARTHARSLCYWGRFGLKSGRLSVARWWLDGGWTRFARYMTYFRPVGLVWVEPARCWRYGPHVFLVFYRPKDAMVSVLLDFYRPKDAMVIVLLEFYRLIYGLVFVLLEFYRPKDAMVFVLLEFYRPIYGLVFVLLEFYRGISE